MKYILVTGAYGGMGKATVELLVKQGFSVFAMDKSIGEPTESVIPLQVDVTDEKSIIEAYEKISVITDELYAIIHFAGIYVLDSLVEIDTEKLIQAFQINLIGAALINKQFISLLKKDSRIVIITSELATIAPLPFTGIYAITKSALDKYAYSLRMELELLDIRVSVIRAGAVDTGMLGSSVAALDRFREKTKLFRYNAGRFKKIVDSVEARSVKPERISALIYSVLNKKRPRFAYSLNRNFLLKLFNALPSAAQFMIIKKILAEPT